MENNETITLAKDEVALIIRPRDEDSFEIKIRQGAQLDTLPEDSPEFIDALFNYVMALGLAFLAVEDLDLVMEAGNEALLQDGQ